MTRSTAFRPSAAALWLLGAVLTACGTPASPTTPAGNSDGVYAPEDSFTATWRLQDAFKIRPQANTTAPTIDGVSLPRGGSVTIPGYYVWDTWPLVGTDNQLARVDGYYVMFMLSVPNTLNGQVLLPGKRHDIATIRYVYSKDGVSWKDGGYAFENPAGLNPHVVLGSRNWAGSAMLKDGQVYLYYTATGVEGERTTPQSVPRQLTVPLAAPDTAGISPQSSCAYGCTVDGISFRQRLALAVGTMKGDASGVKIAGAFAHRIVLEADGKLYQTEAQSKGSIIYSFRDPWIFKDPKDGNFYMLFEGNTGGNGDEQTCKPENIGDAAFASTVKLPADARYYNGNIGLAKAVGNDLTKWQLLAPILNANCVNQQTERPHLVFQDSRYYLFTDSHKFTFSTVPGLRDRGVDGVYGFVGNALRSKYVPLNKSALVINNPVEQPYQAYSWWITQDKVTISFIDTWAVKPTESPESFGNLSPEKQKYGFGGTLAPSIKVQLSGAATSVQTTLPYGQLTP